MKIPKIIEKTVLKSDQVKDKIDNVKKETKEEVKQDLDQKYKAEYNKQIVKTVEEAISQARKDWALETAKALDSRFGASRKYVSTSGYGTGEMFAKTYDSGKNYTTLSTLFSDSPGSIQSASRIRDAIIGGGYVIKKEKNFADYKRNKGDLDKLIKFFDNPNPEDTIETLLEVSIENYLAYGNFYWELVPTRGTENKKNKKIAEVYNLDPTKMTILVDADKKKKGVLEKVGYKRKTQQNKSVVYDKNEIFHVRRPNRKADLYGRAVLEDNMATLQLLLRALTYNINILRNGGRPPMQLILPDDSTEADADAVSAYFEKNYMGPHNARKTLIGFKGAKAESLGVTPEEMAYLELLKYGLRLVAGQYGVPLLLIGFPEGTNRATASEARRAFYITTIARLRKLIAQKITEQIIKKGMGIEGYRLGFRTAGLEESEASRRDFILARDKGLYSFNEARVAMGQLPIDEPWAEKYYLVSTKQDSLVEVKEAINREPDKQAPDAPEPKPNRGRGEEDPAEDESSHDE